MRIGADALQKMITRNQRLENEISALKAKYAKDVEQIRAIADMLVAKAKGPVENITIKPVENTPTPAPAPAVAQPPAEVKREPLHEKHLVGRHPSQVRIGAIRGLETRTYSALAKVGVHVVADLSKVKLAQLRGLKNCGDKTINEISRLMTRNGYTLR
jgi:hypothetical protein